MSRGAGGFASMWVRAANSRGAALLVLPCEQYRILSSDPRALCDVWGRSPERPCVSRHGDYAEPPALVPAAYVNRLVGLRGDVGARSVLYRSEWQSPIEVIKPRAAFDLDRPVAARDAASWSERRSA